MSAQIIPFPRGWQRPEHWTGMHEHHFEHLRNDGLSIEEAAAKIEAHIHIERVIPGESDRLLRMARESLRLLKATN